MNGCWLLVTVFVLVGRLIAKGTGASPSETLQWRRVDKTIEGVSAVDEAFVLVPADYETDASSSSHPPSLLSINVRRFTKRSRHAGTVNVWYIPGGPGQSSAALEAYLPTMLPLVPDGTVFYAIDHRGLGHSTPLAEEDAHLLTQLLPNDVSLLPRILEQRQRQLGIAVPLTRALRVENVARDLLTGVRLAGREEHAPRRNVLVAISYGTVIARRAIQLAPDLFEAVLLDGLAAIERIEFSNESDRLLQEFCDSVPACRRRLLQVTGRGGGGERRDGSPRAQSPQLLLRELIPRIVEGPANQCKERFVSVFVDSRHASMCDGLHAMLNAALLQGRTSLKIAALRMLFEMVDCVNVDGFTRLVRVQERALRDEKNVNQLQGVKSAETAEGGDGAKIATSANTATTATTTTTTATTGALMATNELVFEVVSALERYDITRASIDICFNKKHVNRDDTRQGCPARLFDPCVFFQQTYDRKMALLELTGSLPSLSLHDPRVKSNTTRFLVLAGSLDFSTSTLLSRQIAEQFITGRQVQRHELFGYGHGIFGLGDCDAEIIRDLLDGGERTGRCIATQSRRSRDQIESFWFTASLETIAASIQ